MSEYSYQIHKILNNPTSTTGFNPALNKYGTRLIVGDGQLPDFNTGNTPSADGMFKVYRISHDPRRHIRSFSQLGPTMIGSDLEGLGNSVGINSTGNLIIASSNKTIFNIYKYNTVTGSWDIVFSPGENHGIAGNFFIGGFRYDSNFRYIITAALFPDINGVTTKLLCYKLTGPNIWTRPAYTNEQDFIDLFIQIRGLSCSDILSQPDITGPVVAQLQKGDSDNHVVVSVIAIKETEAVPYGSITTYDNSDDYIQTSVGINKKADRLGVTYFKDNMVQAQIYKWDSNIENWVTQNLIQLNPVLPFAYPLSYIYLSDEMSGEYVSKFCLSMNYSIASDPIYGIYKYNTDTEAYEQEVSFGDKLIALAGDNPLPMGFLGSYVSDDFNTIATSFVGPDPDPQNNPPFGPANYPTTPAPGISNVGDIMSQGISLALFINATNKFPPEPTPKPPQAPSKGLSTSTKVLIGVAGVLIILGLIFYKIKNRYKNGLF